MIAQYTVKLKSQKVSGEFVLTYQEGLLKIVVFNLSGQLSSEQFDWLMAAIPQKEIFFKEKFAKYGQFEVIEPVVEIKTAYEKIAYFCELYFASKNIKYKVSASDSGKIKALPITKELLQFYFKSDNWLIKDRHSIAHLVRNYNEIVALSKGAKIGPKKETTMPDYYSHDYESKLTTADLPKYWGHLRQLGFKPVYARGTKRVIDWKRPAGHGSPEQSPATFEE